MVVGKKCNPTIVVIMLVIIAMSLGYLIVNISVNREAPVAPLHAAIWNRTVRQHKQLGVAS